MFIDSTGRAYSLDAHQLPAARGYGEPLSGTVDPPDGATFAAVLIGEPDDLWLLASDAGYGFAVQLRELYARNKKGKSVLKVPENARVLPAQPIAQPAALAIFVNNDGEVLALAGGANRRDDAPARDRIYSAFRARNPPSATSTWWRWRWSRPARC